MAGRAILWVRRLDGAVDDGPNVESLMLTPTGLWKLQRGGKVKRISKSAAADWFQQYAVGIPSWRCVLKTPGSKRVDGTKLRDWHVDGIRLEGAIRNARRQARRLVNSFYKDALSAHGKMIVELYLGGVAGLEHYTFYRTEITPTKRRLTHPKRGKKRVLVKNA